MILEELSKRDTAEFMAACHYLRTVPSNCTANLGLRQDGMLVAIACYGPCHAPKLAKTFTELRRLAASPFMLLPLSAFLAATIREMRKREAQALITWADPGAGHHGGIYQATNWIYCEPRSYNWNASYRTPFGEILTHRQVFDRYGTSAKDKVLTLHPDWTAFLPPMKHRYIYPLRLKKTECLELMQAREKPYPKPGAAGTPPRRPPMSARQMEQIG